MSFLLYAFIAFFILLDLFLRHPVSFVILSFSFLSIEVTLNTVLILLSQCCLYRAFGKLE